MKNRGAGASSTSRLPEHPGSGFLITVASTGTGRIRLQGYPRGVLATGRGAWLSSIIMPITLSNTRRSS